MLYKISPALNMFCMFRTVKTEMVRNVVVIFDNLNILGFCNNACNIPKWILAIFLIPSSVST
jgi:hypothetical protein